MANSAPPVGAWSSGLCDCFDDVEGCCLTFFCPCVTFGRIAGIVDQGATSCCASGALYFLLSAAAGLGCLYSCCYRSRLRARYGLADKPCADCCVHLCCETLALCQEYRELKSRGFDMSQGWEGNVKAGAAATAPPPHESRDVALAQRVRAAGQIRARCQASDRIQLYLYICFHLCGVRVSFDLCIRWCNDRLHQSLSDDRLCLITFSPQLMCEG